MYVRTATPDDALDVRRILDAAMLEPGDVEARIGDGDVLVAGDGRDGSGAAVRGDESAPGTAVTDERILGALVLVPHETDGVGEPNESPERDALCGAHISAIAVRRRYRGREIGRELVDCALERERRITARFDATVRPFYESLGFTIEPVDEDRFRGEIDGADSVGDGDNGTESHDNADGSAGTGDD